MGIQHYIPNNDFDFYGVKMDMDVKILSFAISLQNMYIRLPAKMG